MARYFVPFSGDKPAPVQVNGHRLLILSKAQEAFEAFLEESAENHVEIINGGNSKEEETKAFNKIAKVSGAGIVIAPEEVSLTDVIRNLENQLPWVQ